MIDVITEVVVTGFVAGVASGTVVLFVSWPLSAAINLIKSVMKGDDET